MKTNLLMKRLLLLWVFAFSTTLWGQTPQQLEYTMANSVKKADLTATNGWTWTGLGSDYSSSGSNIKFDDAGDNATLVIASAPSTVKYNLKSNGLGGLYKFELSESVDGSTFTVTQSITTGIGTTNTVFETNLLSSTRYLKWTYVNKASGNVGFGGVNVKASTCTTSEFSFAFSTVTKTTDDEAFTNIFTTNNTSTKAYTSSNTGVATVNASSGEVTIVGAGTTTIGVTQIGDGTHCAVSASYSLSVLSNEKPVITTPTAQTGMVGVAYSYQIVASENPDSYALTGTLPTGVSLNTSTGVISGTPTEAGIFNTTLTATNFGGTSVPVEFDFTVAKGTQTATLPNLILNVGDVSVTLPAQTNEGIDITYSGSNNSVASITGNVLTVGSAGSATITASNPGDPNYELYNTSFTVTVSTAPCFVEDFVEITVGNNTTTSGSSSAWDGNLNFPTITTGYQAGGAVRLGSGSNIGSVTSKLLSTIGGDVRVMVDVKGWTTVEGSLKVSLGAQSQTVVYTSTISDPFETKTLDFTNVPVGSKLKIETTAKRAFIDNVQVSCGTATIWNGDSWSNGTPDSTIYAIIAEDYSGPALIAKSVTINADKTLTINSSVTTGDLTNNGAIILSDNASLMQTPEGNYSGAGTFTVNRNAVSEAGKYAFWSSPVVDQNMYDIFSTVPQYVMVYNTGSNYYDIVTGHDAKAKKGIGYSISTPDPAPTVSAFVGVPNNATISTELKLDSYKFNLVGNPYPSNLDLTKLFSANTDNIESTLWFWDNTSGPVQTQDGTTAASNGYATFNAAGTGVWVPATSVNATNQPDGVVAKIGQGFIVKAKSTSLLFNNDMRTAEVGNNFNKSTGIANEGKFWLTLTTPYNTKITQAITYQNEASNSYDDYDSKGRSNGSDAFYSFVGAEKVIIQGKASFNVDDVVVLGNKHFKNGNFKIELTKTEGLFAEGQAIYLRDKVAGTETNLQQGAYLFSANAGDYADRFEVVYKQPTLATGSSVKATLAVYRNGDNFVIDSPSKISSVEVYDASGKVVKMLKSSGNKETVSNLSRGVYVFKITTATEIVTKKVIK